MSNLVEAFNHAARMSDPAYLRKLARRRETAIERLRLQIAKELAIQIEREMFEAWLRSYPKDIVGSGEAYRDLVAFAQGRVQEAFSFRYAMRFEYRPSWQLTFGAF